MAFDWKRLEDEERGRVDQVTFGMGVGGLVVGLVGGVVVLLLGRTDKIVTAVFAIVFGALLLLVSGRLRRRRRGTDGVTRGS